MMFSRIRTSLGPRAGESQIPNSPSSPLGMIQIGLTNVSPTDSGYQPYLDIPQPDPGCKVLVRSPADTTQAGCGFLKGAFGNAACAVLSIEKTFMVQFCCGLGDCNAAGAGARRIKRSAKFGDVTVFEELDKEAFNAAAAGGGMFSYKLRSANGSVIEPAAIGLPPDTTTDRASKDAQAAVPAVKKSVSNPLQARVDKCEEGSWVPDAGKEDYTKPADGTQVVYGSVSGPATIEITKARTQDWTTTMDASLGFGNILSMGISFSNEYGESITDTKSQSFPVPAGQTGSVGFTPYLECTTGKITTLTPFNQTNVRVSGR